MSVDLGKYSTAQEVQRSITKLAIDSINKEYPPPKTAEVRSINVDERYCMVIYLGEVNEVRVPFTSVMPSYAGQFVRIGGAFNDRHIIEVLGASDVEDRLNSLQQATQYVCGKWFLASNAVATTKIVIPIGSVDPVAGFSPVGGLINTGGVITLPVDGYWSVNGNFYTSSVSSGSIYLHCIPISGNAEYDIIITGSTSSDSRVMFHIYEEAYLFEGDKISIMADNITFQGLAVGYRTDLIVKLSYAGPKL